MNIFFAHTLADLYGSSRSMLQLCRGLVGQGHGVMVVLSEDGPLVQALTEAGVEVEVLPFLPVLHRSRIRHPLALVTLMGHTLRAAFTLRRRMRAFHADIVHTNSGAVFLAPGLAARMARIPHVWQIRESFAEFGRMWSVYRRMILSVSDRVVCISRGLTGLFPPASRKVTVVYNGIAPDEIYALPEEAIVAFRETYAEPSAPFIGVLSRLNVQRKGQGDVIRAVTLLKERHADLQALIVGSPFVDNPEHLDELQAMAKAGGVTERVHFTGDVDDNNLVLNALDIVVVPSTIPEGFGRVSVEAMALGKPVVGTRIGGTIEIVQDGVTGLLVEPGNPGDLARALDELLSDPALRERLGAAGRKRFLDTFTIDHTLENMLALYRELNNHAKAHPQVGASR